MEFAVFIGISILLILYIYKKAAAANEDSKPSRTDRIFLCGAIIVFFAVGLITAKTIMDFLELVGFFMPFLGVPLVLTAFNIRNLAFNINRGCICNDLISILLGGFYWVFCVNIFHDITVADYNTAVHQGRLHEYISAEYGSPVVTLILLGIGALCLLCAFPKIKQPPLITAVATALTVIMLALFLVVHIQLAKDFMASDLMLWLYYLNLVIIAVRTIRYNIAEQVRLCNERETQFRTKLGEKLHSLMSRVSGMTAFSFMMIFPIIAVVEILYIVAGQGPDGFIKAFTMTADWTFSTQTPPPPLEYSGHYLCTVAAGGHEKVVKPLRYGVRRGEKIVVNRQLLAANAFEDMIMERMPRFHKAVRSFYDRHGYPVSRLITTKLRADIVYIIMKPLEWLFILSLYMFDPHPENRIAVQYSGYRRQRP